MLREHFALVVVRRLLLAIFVLGLTACDRSMPGLSAPATDRELEDSARVLAGLEVRSDSPLSVVQRSPQYAALREEIDSVWARWADRELPPMRAWARSHLGDLLGDLPPATVFYPFSGPDILHATTLFPQARDFLLLGLEPVGRLPDVIDLPPDEILAAMRAIHGALGTILGHENYFVTKEMRQEVGDHAYNGVAGIAAWFLVRLGYELTGARYVALGEDGTLSSVNAPSGPLAAGQGLEIRFRRRGGRAQGGAEPEQRMWYFPGDLSDRSLHRRTRLLAFLGARGGVVTLVKAASYLMFRPDFDDMRSTLLARSLAIVQDASGIPWHDLAGPGWRVDFYGGYVGPMKLFPERCQPDLVAALAARPPAPLPFRFGYIPSRPFLLVARRREANPLFEPTFDGNPHRGQSTSCEKGQLVVRDTDATSR